MKQIPKNGKRLGSVDHLAKDDLNLFDVIDCSISHKIPIVPAQGAHCRAVRDDPIPVS